MPYSSLFYRIVSVSFDCLCALSLFGIWPRYIEPTWLQKRKLNVPIPDLHRDLEGFRFVQLSDLHLNSRTPQRLLDQVRFTVQREQPDLLLFTGDFINRGHLTHEHRMKSFLLSLPATTKIAVLGNHDYDAYGTSSRENAITIHRPDDTPLLLRPFVRSQPPSAKIHSPVRPHPQLCAVLAQCGFEIVENQTIQVSHKQAHLNVCGVGELLLHRADLPTTFSNYDSAWPGIIALHNPDLLPRLPAFPGEFVVAGHTHGGQVNLPWIWKRLIRLQYPKYKSGLFHEFGKMLYVNRGMGGQEPFRLFSRPEIVIGRLQRAKD